MIHIYHWVDGDFIVSTYQYTRVSLGNVYIGCCPLTRSTLYCNDVIYFQVILFCCKSSKHGIWCWPGLFKHWLDIGLDVDAGLDFIDFSKPFSKTVRWHWGISFPPDCLGPCFAQHFDGEDCWQFSFTVSSQLHPNTYTGSVSSYDH